ncbi:hypothetical protein FUA23_20815 [Neolewinella aurantiaca]|uniref:Uncharacterized protein n=1 Tax=Neolewinella aurantiaca TaxID=2602767 RepID=A0A5C7FD69_9BACT|nr:hypothetical protein [Neolewinella aurantiaca]TXF85247.1 hypothetical protein FUA23_20815 [Neolewinella aurantiaca]
MASRLNQRLIKHQSDVVFELPQAASPAQDDQLADEMEIFGRAEPVLIVQITKFTQLWSEHELEW